MHCVVQGTRISATKRPLAVPQRISLGIDFCPSNIAQNFTIPKAYQYHVQNCVFTGTRVTVANEFLLRQFLFCRFIDATLREVMGSIIYRST